MSEEDLDLEKNYKKKKIIRRKTQFNIDLNQDKKTKTSLNMDLSIKENPVISSTQQKIPKENKLDIDESSIKKSSQKTEIIFALVGLITLTFFIIIIVNTLFDILHYLK